jgi:hypothetical protein
MFQEGNVSDREGSYDEALAAMSAFLDAHEDGVAILDAVCPTHEWRLKVRCEVQRMGVKLVFIEVHNDDPTFLDSQVRLIAARSPDYADSPFSVSPASASSSEGGGEEGGDEAQKVADIRARIASYEQHYEPLSQQHAIESKWR